MTCPNKNSAEWKALVSQVGEAEAYHLYVQNNFDIPVISELKPNINSIESRQKYIESVRVPIQDAEFGDGILGQMSTMLADRMLNLTNIPTYVITRNQATALDLPNTSSSRSYSNSKGIWDRDNRIAYIIKENATPTTIVHEAFAHPFLDYVEKERPILYDNLINQAKSIKSVDDAVKSAGYSKEEYDLGEEHVTAAIEMELANRLIGTKAEESALKRFKNTIREYLRAFRSMIRDTFGLNSINTIKDDITFQELGDLILYSGSKFNLDVLLNNSNKSGVSESRMLSTERTRDIDTIRNILETQTDKVEFLSETHQYINKNTGEEYKPVSTVKSEYGYGDNLDKGNMDMDKYKLSSFIGTSVHDYINSMIIGKEYNDSINSKISTEAKNQLNGLIKTWSTITEIVGSEMLLTDDNSLIAGTMDLMVKDKSGNIIQLDFKTKIVDFLDANGKSYTGRRSKPFNYYNSSKYGKPDKLKHDFQQTMYKRMAELLGIDIKYKGIVPIEIVVQKDNTGEYFIKDISVTEHLPINDLHYYNLTTNNEITPLVNSILDIGTGDMSTVMNELAIEKLEDLAKKGISILQKRSAYMVMQGDKFRANLLEDNIKTILEQEAPIEIYNIIESSLDILGSQLKTYNRLLQREKTEGSGVWDLNKLSKWRDNAIAFDGFLDDIQAFYNENPEIFSNIEGFDINEFNALLNGAINAKNTIKQAYKSKGMPIWLKWISKGSKIIEYKYRDDFEKRYRAKFIEDNKNNKDAKFDLEQLKIATDNYIKDNKSIIDLETQQFIKRQANVADKDLNYIYRYADNIFDSQDPIIGTMSKIYYSKMLEMRQTFNNWYIDLANIMNDFDKTYKGNVLSDDAKIYDYLLDYEGNTINIVKRIPQSFVTAYQEQRSKLRNDKSIDERTRSILWFDWLNKNAPIATEKIEDYKQDRLNVYETLLEQGEISENDYNVLTQNENSQYPLSLKRLVSAKDISADTAQIVDPELKDLEWDYRLPDSKLYPNKKYNDIMKLDLNDPKRRLFDFLGKTITRGDNKVPKRFKLGNKLPGVRKEFLERLTNGQNFLESSKEYIKESYSVMSDDTTRGISSDLANELDQGVNIVPVYFTNAVDKSDQSLDIPNIYKEWYKSVLNYEFTNHILPELEFTRDIINNRKVLKHKNGSPIVNKLSQLYNRRNQDVESLEAYVSSENNRLAQQLNDWFTQWIYGKSERDFGKIGKVDVGKGLRAIGNFTSLKIMGLNLMSMVNNSAMAEVNQLIEVNARKHMSYASYNKAGFEYTKDLVNVLGDVGQRVYTSKTNLALEYFNVFFEMSEKNQFRERGFFSRMFKQSALFVTTNLGEHEAQSRFMIGMLLDTKVKDHKGNDAGNLWNNITVKDGKLNINPNIEFSQDDVTALSRKMTSALRELHGNYSDYSRVAMSMNGITSLLLMFRKWIIPGIRRRYDKKYFDEFSESYRLGYWRGGFNRYSKVANARYAKMLSFFGKQMDEAKALDIALILDKNSITEVERQAVRRLNTDALILSTGMILFMALEGLKDAEGDDMEEFELIALNNLMYQVYRIRTEQFAYINPQDALAMFKSPMPSVNVVSSLMGVIQQGLFDPTEEYQSGRRAGENKFLWKAYDNVPLVRQIYRVTKSEDSLKMLQNPGAF